MLQPGFATTAVADDDGRWSVVRPEWGGDVHGVERRDDERDHGTHFWWRHRQPFGVKIIGFNDFHGNLQSPGSFSVNTSIPAAQRPALRRRGEAIVVLVHQGASRARACRTSTAATATAAAPTWPRS